MAITKEKYRQVLEEGIECWEILKGMRQELKDVLEMIENGNCEKRDLFVTVKNILGRNEPPMVDTRVEYVMLMKKWKELERLKKVQAVRRKRHLAEGLTSIGMPRVVSLEEKDHLGMVEKRRDKDRDRHEEYREDERIKTEMEVRTQSIIVKVDTDQKLTDTMIKPRDTNVKWKSERKAGHVGGLWMISDPDRRTFSIVYNDDGTISCMAEEDGKPICRINEDMIKDFPKKEKVKRKFGQGSE
jgi:hypothetical protein